MTTSVKVIVAGPTDGPQHSVVSLISEVKVPSSVRDPTTSRHVPMELGRVRVGDEFDLQIYGCERENVRVIEESVTPGVVGAIVFMGAHDVLKPDEALEALDELSEMELPTIVAAPVDFEASLLSSELGIGAKQVFQFSSIERGDAKRMLLHLIEVALNTSESKPPPG